MQTPWRGPVLQHLRGALPQVPVLFTLWRERVPMRYSILWLLLPTVFVMWTAGAKARVERIEILDRQVVAGGAAFGASGAYEKIRGRAWLALDPQASANAVIADLALATRDARGLVSFRAEFLMLRPADP